MFIRTFLSPSFVAIVCATACCGPTYIRVPAVCPRDPLCLAPEPGSADAPERERDFIRRHADATVEVRGTRYLPNKGPSITKGIGALVGPKGYVLTAYHLVDGAEQVTVAVRTLGPDGAIASVREMPGTPLVLSREADLALIALPMSESLPRSLPVRYGPVIKGDPVWFLGAGTELKRGGVIETGIIDGPNSDHADASIAAVREDAGAPILNVCGELVGVSTGPYGKHGRLRFIPIDAVLKALQISVADLR